MDLQGTCVVSIAFFFGAAGSIWKALDIVNTKKKDIIQNSKIIHSVLFKQFMKRVEELACDGDGIDENDDEGQSDLMQEIDKLAHCGSTLVYFYKIKKTVDERIGLMFRYMITASALTLLGIVLLNDSLLNSPTISGVFVMLGVYCLFLVITRYNTIKRLLERTEKYVDDRHVTFEKIWHDETDEVDTVIDVTSRPTSKAGSKQKKLGDFK